MVDPYLAALARAAEAGTQCPHIWMTLHSGDLVSRCASTSAEAASIAHTGPVPCKPALVRQWRVMGTSLKGYQRGVDQIISKEPQGAATIRAATRKFTAVTVAVGNPVGPVLINLAATL